MMYLRKAEITKLERQLAKARADSKSRSERIANLEHSIDIKRIEYASFQKTTKRFGMPCLPLAEATWWLILLVQQRMISTGYVPKPFFDSSFGKGVALTAAVAAPLAAGGLITTGAVTAVATQKSANASVATARHDSALAPPDADTGPPRLRKRGEL